MPTFMPKHTHSNPWKNLHSPTPNTHNTLSVCIGTSSCNQGDREFVFVLTLAAASRAAEDLEELAPRLEVMATSQSHPHGCMASTTDDVPGDAKSLTSKAVDGGAGLLQSLNPISAFQQHICTWALFSHDMKRQIETHHYAARLNEDFLQCAVYDSDESNARLIGVEYVVSEKVFQTLPAEEKQLWHSHNYEIKEGLWVNPGVPESVQKQELKGLANTYGKFWCTWQFDRGDRLPLGAPALMMSPQAEAPGRIPDDDVAKRDAKYDISSKARKNDRADINQMKPDPNADRWRQTGKGFAVDLKEVLMTLG